MPKDFPSLRRSALACAMFELIEAKTDVRRAEAIAEALDIAGRGALVTILDDIRNGMSFVRLISGVAVLSNARIEPSCLAEFSKTIKHARSFVSEALNAPLPVIVINVVSGPCDIYIQGGTDGFGLLHISVENLNDEDMFSALVHELTHAVILSGNLFLDEGLAVAMEHLANDRLPANFALGFEAPGVQAILATDWANDPYFAALTSAGLSRPHDIAAAFVNAVLSCSGANVANFAAFMGHEKIKLTGFLVGDVIEENFNVLLDHLQQPAIDDIQALHEIPALAAKVLALGDISTAAKILPKVRHLQRQADTDKLSILNANAAAAKVFLCLALSQQPHAHLYTGEAITAIARVEKINPNAPEAYMFRAYKAVLDGQTAGSPIERNVANGLAAELYASAVNAYPEHVEIVVATAKAQTYLPETSLVNNQTWSELLGRFKRHPDMSSIVTTLLSHSLLKQGMPSC